MWGSAPFERVAETLAEMHRAIVEAVDGGRATGGSTSAAVRASSHSWPSRRARRSTGSDLSPVLIETARGQAAERGCDVTFEEGDAEALPYPRRELRHRDVVGRRDLRARPQAVAAELARVCRPGGRLGAHRLDDRRRDRRVLPNHRLVRAAAAPGRRSRRLVGRARLRGVAARRELRADGHDARTRPGGRRRATSCGRRCRESFGPIKTLLGALPPERAEASSGS